MTTGLTWPVIIATVHGSAPGERLALLIDGGTHRLYTAHATATAQLPAWVLTRVQPRQSTAAPARARIPERGAPAAPATPPPCRQPSRA